MKSFGHATPRTVKEAVTWLERSRGKAKIIAGGTDLLGLLKNEVLRDFPEAIIDIKAIPSLRYIREDRSGLKIGASTKLANIAHSELVKKTHPALAEAARSVGSPQIRNMATIGGNLCQDVRCWFYRASPFVGEPYDCIRKGGKRCYALTGQNRYHSVFGASEMDHASCRDRCPGHINIPAYLDRIREGDLDSAARILLEGNPIPAITGRVCHHFCEKGCVRNEFDEPVSVGGIERFVGDYVLDHADRFFKPIKDLTGKKVAIVGSGPAGLSAAFYLVRMGHQVSIFERMADAGGMLFYGIPPYVLPRDIVKRTVKAIEKAGARFTLGVEVGADISLEGLKKEYDGLFIGTGAWCTRKIGIEGEELTRPALSLLTGLDSGLDEIAGKRVLVVGGGNVAVDTARTALRLGSREVTMIYRRSREEMPAYPEKVREALKEGVKILYLTSPVRVMVSNGRVEGCECIRNELGKPDESGRRRPIPMDGSQFVIPCDAILPAIGQSPDLSWTSDISGLERSRYGTLVVDRDTGQTSLPKVFASGDAVSGPKTVIDAVASARKTALAMDRFLTGAKGHEGTRSEGKGRLLRFGDDCIERKKRARMPTAPRSRRAIDVEDVGSLKGKEVEEESKRCFSCGCVAVNPSDLATVLLALDAQIKIAGPEGNRIVPVGDFFTPSGNDLRKGEMVTEILIPRPKKGFHQVFLKFRERRAIDFAVTSVAAKVVQKDGVCRDARIVLGAVAPMPIRVEDAEREIKGRVIETATAQAAAKASVLGTVALTENSYKVDITRALVKRALLSCANPDRK